MTDPTMYPPPPQQPPPADPYGPRHALPQPPPAPMGPPPVQGELVAVPRHMGPSRRMVLGPPPRSPIRPVEQSCSHVLHLVLTLLTFGMWGIVWVCVALVTRSNNRAAAQRYERDLAQYEHDMWQWEEAREAYRRGGAG